jgi:CO/xanthine dehydrogenase Mo-binding subunit
MEAHVQPIVVKLAMLTSRPVKCILSREEDFEMVRARPARSGFAPASSAMGHSSPAGRAAGGRRRLRRRQPGRARLRAADGARAYQFRIPMSWPHGLRNKLRFAAFRGFEIRQRSPASQIDDIADRLGIDPLNRLKNALRQADTWFGGQPLRPSA